MKRVNVKNSWEGAERWLDFLEIVLRRPLDRAPGRLFKLLIGPVIRLELKLWTLYPNGAIDKGLTSRLIGRAFH